MPPTVLIVDDHTAVRASLREWLGSALPRYLFIEAGSGEEAVTTARAVRPWVVLMDITLPRMSGIEATRQIKAALPDTHVVILTIHENEYYRSDAVSAGASAYIPKRQMWTELLPTLAALPGNPALDQPVVERDEAEHNHGLPKEKTIDGPKQA